MIFRFLLLCCVYVLCLPAFAQGLPPQVQAALARAKVPQDPVAVLVVDAQADPKSDSASPVRLSH